MKSDPTTHARGKPRQEDVSSCRWEAGRSPVYRPTWVEIDQNAFRRNIAAIRAKLKKGTKVLAVVKANAYGHLAAPLSRIAVKNGAAALGVSSIEEGIALREAGITAPALILGSLYPLENLAVAARYRLVPTISSRQGLLELARQGRRAERPLPFHLKIDTGMGRIGVSPGTAEPLLATIAALKEVRMAGMYMHFACADTDDGCTRHQLAQFTELVRRARALGLRFSAHAANSAALLRSRATHLDMVRPGLALYGLPPFEEAENTASLAPVLAWKTRIVFLKKVPARTGISYGRTYTTRRASTIATLPVGYADGYPRTLSSRAAVLIRGKRCPVIGRVTMDMVMVDVTAVKDAAIGDEAVLIGAQGAGRIRAGELARLAATIQYEITCAISARVPRVLV